MRSLLVVFALIVLVITAPTMADRGAGTLRVWKR
jgi:hypothetical protein